LFVIGWFSVDGWFGPRHGDGFGELGQAMLGALLFAIGLVALVTGLLIPVIPAKAGTQTGPMFGRDAPMFVTGTAAVFLSGPGPRPPPG
jgi:hypothetical protein